MNLFPINSDVIFGEILQFVRRFGLALIIILISIIIGRLWRVLVHRFATRRKLPIDMTNLMAQITQVVILAFGVVTALGTIGIDVGALIAGLGLIGFALGFALRDLLSNFLSGLMILLYNPFVRGDIISVTGNEGTVTEINMRYTVLQNEQKRILIPNQNLFSNTVVVSKKNGNPVL